MTTVMRARMLGRMFELLQLLMQAHDDNQYTLAEKSGVPQPTIGRILSGKHADPRSTTVKKIAAAYGLRESHLRGDEAIPAHYSWPATMKGLSARHQAEDQGFAEKVSVTLIAASMSTAAKGSASNGIAAPRANDFASVDSGKTIFDTELGAEEMGAAPQPRPVPVVGMARLGDNGFYEEISTIPGAGDGHVMGYYTGDPEAYCLQVRGDSMFPAIKNGWFIVVEPRTRLAQGEYVVLKLHNGKKMVKELLYERSDSLTVVSVNGGIQQTIMREDLQDAQAVGTILPPSKWKPV